tara:strand:- start:1279 stop:1533 length:255 start_codon:yes stop_codon:yes gene_type:complete
MRLPIIKAIASNDSISQSDLTTTVETLESISAARGLNDEELDVIGELISNIEGAKIVIEDNRHYGTPLREALNKFMKRVINSIS